LETNTSTPEVICGKCRQEYPGDALFCPMCGAAKARDFEGDPLVGTVIGDRYLIVERIGHGASGTIYRGEQTALRRKVAVKVLHHELSRDELAMERFRRAATTVSEIDNEHIVAIHDFGRTGDGRLYLAMELLDGETLYELMQREHQLPIERSVDILVQLGEALMEAHAMGYIHRDLRPRNIFLSRRRGHENYVKILDFGLAKLVEKEGEAASTSLGMTFGDPRYMSPEQARGDPVDRRADIYSLGCIAYEMIVGDAPFNAPKVFEVLTQHLERPPKPPIDRRPDCPPWLNSAILCALAKRPDERFMTIFRFVQALKDGSSTGEIMAMTTARRKETIQPPTVTATLQKFGLDSERSPSEVDARDTEKSPSPFEPAATLPPSRLGPSEDVDDDEVDGRKTIPVAHGKSGPRKSTSKPVASGISQAWYADGEALTSAVEEGASESQIRTKLRRPVIESSNTGLISYEDEFGTNKKRILIIVGAILLLGLGVAVAMSLAGGGDDDESKDTEPVASLTPPDAAPVAVTATVDAGVAAAVAADAAPAVERPPDRVVKKPPPDRGPPDHLIRKPPPDNPPPDKPPPDKPANEKQADFYAKLGVKDLRNNDVLGAAGNFKKALDFDANNVDAIAGMGEIALTQGQARGAIAHLKKAARLRPRDAKIHTLLGEAYLSSGNDKAAAAAFKKALKIDPDNTIARNGYNEAIGREPVDEDLE
jgi:serine/threonine protein kinase